MKNIILNVTLVGISVVFLSLIALSFLVYLYPKIISFFKRKKSDTDKDIKKAKVKNPIKEDITSATEKQSNDNDIEDEELIAVITAAIAASMGHEYSSKVKVKSFKRVNASSPVWNTSGRYESLN